MPLAPLGDVGDERNARLAGMIGTYRDIRWMEEILHQLIDGLSHYL